jgi:imidazolonepropionase-like amidohydrolase
MWLRLMSTSIPTPTPTPTPTPITVTVTSTSTNWVAGVSPRREDAVATDDMAEGMTGAQAEVLRLRSCGHRPAIDRRRGRYAIVGLFIAATLLAGVATARDLGASWAVTGATLIDGTGAPPLVNSVIVGHGERITCAGDRESCTIPTGAVVVDATGKWVIPGLIDTHVHVNWAEHPDDVRRAQLRRFAFGVTTTRDAGTTPSLEADLAARPQANRAAGPEPRLLVSGLVSRAHMERYGGDDVTSLVHRLAALGVDAIKVTEQYPDEQLRAIISAAHANDLPVFGHTWGRDGSHFEAAVAAGIDGLSHMDTIAAFAQPAGVQRPPAPEGIEFWVWAKESWNHTDDARVAAAIDDIVAHHVWFEPMLVNEKWFTLPYPLPSDLAYLDEVPSLRALVRPWIPFGSSGWPATRERRRRIAAVYERVCSFVRRLQARGGVIVTGTDDMEPGPGLLDEVRLLAECGLSPMSALQTATRNAAVALKRQEDRGTLEPGKLADFVILEADPLYDPTNLRRIWRVAKGGHLHDPAALLRPTVEAHRTRLRRTWAWRTVVVLLAAVSLAALVLVWRAIIKRSR